MHISVIGNFTTTIRKNKLYYTSSIVHSCDGRLWLPARRSLGAGGKAAKAERQRARMPDRVTTGSIQSRGANTAPHRSGKASK